MQARIRLVVGQGTRLRWTILYDVQSRKETAPQAKFYHFEHFQTLPELFWAPQARFRKFEPVQMLTCAVEWVGILGSVRFHIRYVKYYCEEFKNPHWEICTLRWEFWFIIAPKSQENFEGYVLFLGYDKLNLAYEKQRLWPMTTLNFVVGQGTCLQCLLVNPLIIWNGRAREFCNRWPLQI